jgi:hypothetical protein
LNLITDLQQRNTLPRPPPVPFRTLRLIVKDPSPDPQPACGQSPKQVETLTLPEESEEKGPAEDQEDERSDHGSYWAEKVQRQQMQENGLVGDEDWDEDIPSDMEYDEDEREQLEGLIAEAEAKMRELRSLSKHSEEDASNGPLEEWELDGDSEDDDDGDGSDYEVCNPRSKSGSLTLIFQELIKQKRTAGKRHKAPKSVKVATQTKEKSRDPKEANAPAGIEFCPPSHRASILRLFAKHSCQHSLLPDRHGQSKTPEEIRTEAVREFYVHCKRHHLRDVWAYAWVNWYSPDYWALWTRGAYGLAIPRKRTTMTVESLWRNYKRISMPHHARIAADYAVSVLIKDTVKVYRNRVLKHTTRNPRKGHTPTMTAEQKSFKAAWEKLREAKIKGTYATDPTSWTCNCGAQKYHSHLLCKHLVQSVPQPSEDWWPQVIRYSTHPFYAVPGVTHPMEPEKITEYAWRSRRINLSESEVATDLPLVTVSRQENMVCINHSLFYRWQLHRGRVVM